MQISQIFFSENNETLPPALKACVETITRQFPNLEHHTYNLETARDLISEQFSNEVMVAFEKIKPYSFKADLFRYCVLYARGGWYFDIATRCYLNVAVPDNVETVAFRDTPPFSGTSWSCSNSVLFSRPNSAVYQRAIEMAISNIKNEYYGTNPLCTTGPILLGRAFAQYGESEKHVFGDYMFLTPLHQIKNPAFVLPNGQLFAMAKEQFVCISTYGANKVNNYVKMWNEKDIFTSGNPIC